MRDTFEMKIDKHKSKQKKLLEGKCHDFLLFDQFNLLRDKFYG